MAVDQTASNMCPLDAEPTKPFRLLDLPTELQLVILELAVIEPDPIEIFDLFWDGEFSTCSLAAEQPALAHVCRSFRHDVLTSYYKKNTFVIRICTADNSRNHVVRWFNSIDMGGRKSVCVLLMSLCDEEYVDDAPDPSQPLNPDVCSDNILDCLEKKGFTVVPAGDDGDHTLWRLSLTGS